MTAFLSNEQQTQATDIMEEEIKMSKNLLYAEGNGNTKHLSRTVIVIRIKLGNTVRKQIITLAAGIRRKFLIGTAS